MTNIVVYVYMSKCYTYRQSEENDLQEYEKN